MSEPSSDPSLQNVTDIGETIRGFAESLRRLIEWWQANREKVLETAAWAVSSVHFAAQLERTGWLPHYTTPDISIGLDDVSADEQIARYYKDQWGQVEEAFLTRLSTYDIDEEAQACFREALQAHRSGLFRVVPRALFPEIERLVRAELGPSMTASAGLRRLREATQDLGGANFVRTGVLTLRLYKAFVERLYARVETDEEVARAEADSVPNRHAAIHARVTYKTQKTSLNALVIAEFVMLTVGAVRAAKAQATTEMEAVLGGDFQLGIGLLNVAGNRNWRRLLSTDVPALPEEIKREII